MIKTSLKFVSKGSINNITALVQKMAWHRPGNKPLSEPMMVNLLTHTCVTRPQWVKHFSNKLLKVFHVVHEFVYFFRCDGVEKGCRDLTKSRDYPITIMATINRCGITNHQIQWHACIFDKTMEYLIPCTALMATNLRAVRADCARDCRCLLGNGGNSQKSREPTMYCRQLNQNAPDL